jgi:glycerophosphoryl diester phosphodiesterase
MAIQLHRNCTGRILVESHRGAEKCGLENSWPALEAAYQAGADLIELDVQLSRDDVPFIRHNYTLPDGRWCRTLDWKELASVRIVGEHLPRLSEVLNWAYSNKVVLSLDMKGGFGGSNHLYTEVLRLV